MNKFFEKTLCFSSVVGMAVVIASSAVSAGEVSVPNTSDANSADSTSQAAPSSAENYGCMTGREGNFNGNQAVSRYEFAAAMNACLNRVNQLLTPDRANLATKDDLANTERRMQDLRADLDRLRTQLDGLDERVKSPNPNK